MMLHREVEIVVIVIVIVVVVVVVASSKLMLNEGTAFRFVSSDSHLLPCQSPFRHTDDTVAR